MKTPERVKTSRPRQGCLCSSWRVTSQQQRKTASTSTFLSPQVWEVHLALKTCFYFPFLWLEDGSLNTSQMCWGRSLIKSGGRKEPGCCFLVSIISQKPKIKLKNVTFRSWHATGKRQIETCKNVFGNLWNNLKTDKSNKNMTSKSLIAKSQFPVFCLNWLVSSFKLLQWASWVYTPFMEGYKEMFRCVYHSGLWVSWDLFLREEWMK